MKHPIYYAFSVAVCGYLLLANARGWSFIQTISPTRWGSFGPSTSHK